MGVIFRWINNNQDVEVRTMSGNYLYTYKQARDAYKDASDGSVVVVTNTMSSVRIDKNGCRHSF